MPDDELENLESLDSDVDILESGDDTSETEETTEESTEETAEETETEEKEEKEGKETEEKTDDEEEDTEEEEPEEEDEEEEETITSHISVKALKEQYPDIFKKNPGLKDVIFREREFSKVFGSVDDAQEAAEQVQTFSTMQESLMGGDIGSLLDAIAESDESSAVAIANNFLPALYERSKPLFAKVTEPVIKAMIRSTYSRAMNTGNKQLALACQYLSRDVFENPDVMKATEFKEEAPDPRRDEIKQEREKLEVQRYQTARGEVYNAVVNRLKKDIVGRLDPKMSEFVRDATAQKILDELDSTLAKDKAHMAHLSSLYKKAQRVGYTSEAKSKIVAASLARAKTILPAVVNKVKASGKKPVKKTEGTKQIPNQNAAKTSQGRSPVKKLDRTVSDYDFIKAP